MKVFDAATGQLLRTFVEVAPAEISSACFDARQRKILLSTVSGSVDTFNMLNGAKMKEGEPHDAEVTNMMLAAEDGCFVTTSWDRSLRVYDELDPVSARPGGCESVARLTRSCRVRAGGVPAAASGEERARNGHLRGGAQLRAGADRHSE